MEARAGSVAAKGLQKLVQKGQMRRKWKRVPRSWQPSQLAGLWFAPVCRLPPYLPSDGGQPHLCSQGLPEHFQVRAKVRAGLELSTLPTRRTMLVTVIGGV